jgi:hypothetical protein
MMNKIDEWHAAGTVDPTSHGNSMKGKGEEKVEQYKRNNYKPA